MAKRILVILGHPHGESFCAALAEQYVRAAGDAGAEVRQIRLGELQFDPVLHNGYRVIQPLEPDLKAAQEAILWAEHLVLVYPNWWGSMPALLKGFIDRTILPGFAFKYRKNSLRWDKYLSGRSAHLFVTMDTPPWYYRWVYRMPGHNQMRRTVLGFTGIKPIRIESLGPVKRASATRREKWLTQVARAARKAAA
jgi:putative NADPH-quinone reductase